MGLYDIIKMVVIGLLALWVVRMVLGEDEAE